MLDLISVRAAAESVALRAAETLMKHFEGPLQQVMKSSTVDIVTEADRETEAAIVSMLTERYPSHHIVGEEGGGMGAPIDKAEYRWYIDPLDGTTNFANRIPIFSISLALTDARRRPLAGVVDHPVAGEMFSAAQGDGATLNGRPIRVSAAERLNDCVLASGFPYDQSTSPENNLRQWASFSVRTRGLRRFGSAAIDLCWVAAGRFDGYWEMKLKPWDYYAGILCVTEAGGLVTAYDGSAGDSLYSGGRVVASNGKIHQQMLDVLAL